MMKGLHCRQAIFRETRKCAHCGPPVLKTTLYSSPDAGTRSAPDLDAIRAVMPLRYCDCFDDGGEIETRFHAEIQDTPSAGWIRLLELIAIAAEDSREE